MPFRNRMFNLLQINHSFQKIKFTHGGQRPRRLKLPRLVFSGIDRLYSGNLVGLTRISLIITSKTDLIKSLMDAVLAKQDKWKCGNCSQFFPTNAILRQHISTEHTELKICRRCPYTLSVSPSHLRVHENAHFRNDVKFKNKTDGRECKLCHVWFGTNGFLINHLRQYHLPESDPK